MPGITRSDLLLSDDDLVAKLRTIDRLEAEASGMSILVDIVHLLELDHQVKNGGFAQYFFNASSQFAFDAWFASQSVGDELYDLMTRAIARVTFELGDEIDLHAIFQSQGGAGINGAYARYVDAMVRGRGSSLDTLRAFAAFRDRVNRRAADWQGLDELTTEYLTAFDMTAAVTKLARENAASFS